jgi:hypothetical protein
MSQSLRFLALAMFAWAGVRAVSLGLVPGAGALAVDRADKGARMASTRLPSVTPSVLPPIEPLFPAIQLPAMTAAVPAPAVAPGYAAYPYPPAIPYPVYIPVSVPRYRVQAPVPPPVEFAEDDGPRPVDPRPMAAPLEVPPLSRLAERTTPPRFDRLQLSSWAMLRAAPGAVSVANAGTLGGSQAGARLLWRFDPHLAASLRTSSAVNADRNGEVALGLRYQPWASVPLAISAERRQALSRLTGRSGFAAYLEGGLYNRSLPAGLMLDSYVQAGAVGARNPLWFADGSAVVSRPIWGNVAAGAGLWGGAQPGLARVEAGPRLSMRVGRMRVHADYRRKLLGRAEPGSGAVLTIAGDF